MQPLFHSFSISSATRLKSHVLVEINEDKLGGFGRGGKTTLSESAEEDETSNFELTGAIVASESRIEEEAGDAVEHAVICVDRRQQMDVVFGESVRALQPSTIAV